MDKGLYAKIKKTITEIEFELDSKTTTVDGEKIATSLNLLLELLREQLPQENTSNSTCSFR